MAPSISSSSSDGEDILTLTSPAATAALRQGNKTQLSHANNIREHQDNFYTPKNDGFYSQNPYLSLDRNKREIRLLRIFPRKKYTEHLQEHPSWNPFRQRNGEPWALSSGQLSEAITTYGNVGSGGIPDLNQDILACEILDKTPLTRVSGAYHALSYYAGKAADTSVILVNGMRFNAFANLEYAIGIALDRWQSEGHGRELLLWVDQICINQQNYGERADQVNMMRDIYKRSLETFICLDTPTSLDPLAWLPTSQDAEDDRGGFDDLVGLFETTLEHNIVAKVWPPTAPDRSQSTTSNAQLQQSESMSRTRTRSPPSSTAFRSHRTPRAPSRAPPPSAGALAQVQNSFKSRLRPMKPQAKTDPWLESLQACLDSPWWTRSWVYQEFIVSPQPRFITSSTSISWSLLEPLLKWVCSDLQARARTLLDDSKSAHSIKAMSELEAKALQGRSESHDLVEKEYKARLRTWKAEQQDLADHHEELKSEKRALKKKIVRIEDRLEQVDTVVDSPISGLFKGKESKWRALGAELERDLERASQQLQRLKRDIATLDAGTRLHRAKKPEAPREWWVIRNEISGSWQTQRALLLFRRAEILSLRTNPVSSMITAKSNPRRKADLKTLLRHARNCQSSDPRDRIYAFMGLAHDDYGLIPSYAATNTIVHVLVESTKRIIERDRSLGILQHVHRGREKLVTMIPTWVPDWTSEEAVDELGRYITMASSQGEKMLYSKSDRDAFTKPEYRSDDWSEGHVDIKVRGRQLCVLEEAGVPLPEFPGLRRIRQSEQCEIVVPKSALPDDEVWILDGASRPVLLRDESKDEYAFLGEVVVLNPDGLSEGQEEDGAQTKWKDIWLI